jgi:hypothetical protein
MEEILEKLKIIEDEIANVKTRINDVGRDTAENFTILKKFLMSQIEDAKQEILKKIEGKK